MIVKTPIKEAIKSKGILAGIGLMIMGGYVVVMQNDVTGGLTILGVGLGILGIRDNA